MRVHFLGDPIPNETTYGIYLMSPEPGAATWRADALRLLSEHSFAGEVYVPASQSVSQLDEAARLAWQESALNQADCVLAPSSTATTAGLELGKFWHPAKGILIADHANGLANAPGILTLEDACREAASERGELRRGGECQIPLDIWRTESFQAWHQAQKSAGNVLHGAHLEWVFRIGPETVFFWALRVDIEVRAEGRRKSNEVILGRPDIATVVLYRRGTDWLQSEVVLVREFRSPACTPDGYVCEFPGGMSRHPGQMADAAVREVNEETGLAIDAARFRFHESRQLVGTLSVHKAHVFSVELTEEEMAALRSQEMANTTHGVAAESEVTSIRVRKVSDLFAAPLTDWSTLGILSTVLHQPPASKLLASD